MRKTPTMLHNYTCLLWTRRTCLSWATFPSEAANPWTTPPELKYKSSKAIKVHPPHTHTHTLPPFLAAASSQTLLHPTAIRLPLCSFLYNLSRVSYLQPGPRPSAGPVQDQDALPASAHSEPLERIFPMALISIISLCCVWKYLLHSFSIQTLWFWI